MILNVLLMVVAIVEGFVIRNLILKNERLEDFIVYLQDQVRNVLRNMKTLDDRHIFEEDDEVGVVFKGIADIIKELESVISPGEPDEKNLKIIYQSSQLRYLVRCILLKLPRKQLLNTISLMIWMNGR